MTKYLQHSMLHLCVYTLFIILVQYSDVTLAGYEHTCDFQSRPHHRGLCGSNLSSMMSTLCAAFRGPRYSKYIVKRNAEKMIDENLRDIMLNKKDAMSYLVKREVNGQGIVCECCYNQCTVFELAQYCDISSISYDRRLNQSS